MALASASLGIHAQQLAFPGAEGYGAYASGGRVHIISVSGFESPSFCYPPPLFKGELPKMVFDTFSYLWVKLSKINRRLTAKTANKPQH